MKNFFSNMNVPRWVILLGAIFSLYLGWQVYEQTARLAAIRSELARAPGLVAEIQRLGLELDQLQKLEGEDGLQNSAPDHYVREVASMSAIEIGQVSVGSRETSPSRGLTDRNNPIEPMSSDRAFSRGQIGNFLYQLEAESPRVKVTSFSISPLNRIKPGEIGDDSWTFKAVITTRELAEP